MANRKPVPTWDEFAQELGHNLRQLRIERGLSQERLAHLAGLSTYTYQKFEKGESRPGVSMNPRLTTLVALCQVLEVELTVLLPTPFPALPDRSTPPV